MASAASDLLTVRVDESGDAGTGGKGTRWLVLAAIAETGKPGELLSSIEAINVQRGRAADATLHFRRIRRSNLKHAAYISLSEVPFSAIVVASDTRTVRPVRGGLAYGRGNPQQHYYYALRYVLERASQMAWSRGRELEFVVEQSRHFDLEAFRRYVDLLRARSGGNDEFMRWDAIAPERIRTAAKQEDVLLGVADGVAHAYFIALEPDQDSRMLMPIYGDMLQPRLWRDPTGGPILRSGFTFIPTSETEGYLREFPYVHRWALEGKQVAPLLWHPGA